MNRKQQVLSMLKPKAKAFGFNRKELQGIAAQIADNLTSADDASDEDVNAEIEEKIDAVLPYLQVGQSYANRLVEDARKKNDDIEPGDEDDNKEPTSNRQPGSRSNKNNEEKNEQTPEWANALLKTVETLTGEITKMKGEKLAGTRKSKLSELLKDSGSFGKRILKSFDKMKFDTDEDFDEFYSDVEEDLKTYNQERADAGLSTLGNPPATGNKGGKAKEDEPFSDKELEEMASSF